VCVLIAKKVESAGEEGRNIAAKGRERAAGAINRGGGGREEKKRKRKKATKLVSVFENGIGSRPADTTGRGARKPIISSKGR